MYSIEICTANDLKRASLGEKTDASHLKGLYQVRKLLNREPDSRLSCFLDKHKGEIFEVYAIQ